MQCHANKFLCTNWCWQCWTMCHYGILCQPHALHASTWQCQTKQRTDQPVHVQLGYHSTDSISCNTLLKALFIFPSWHLFATGLTPIFILTWDLPPTLHSIPKSVILNMHTVANPCPNAVHMEPFSTSIFKILIEISATAAKICNRSCFTKVSTRRCTYKLPCHPTHWCKMRTSLTGYQSPA